MAPMLAPEKGREGDFQAASGHQMGRDPGATASPEPEGGSQGGGAPTMPEEHRGVRVQAERKTSRDLCSKWQLPNLQTGQAQAQARQGGARGEPRGHSLLLFTKPRAPGPWSGSQAVSP